MLLKWQIYPQGVGGMGAVEEKEETSGEQEGTRRRSDGASAEERMT